MTNFTHRSIDVERDENGIDINAHGARIDALVKKRLGNNSQLLGFVKVSEWQQNDGVTMEQQYIVCSIRGERGEIAINKAMLDSSGQTGLVSGDYLHAEEHRGLAHMIARALDQQFHMRV